jgi:DNA-binding LacI/PurR family transcriptional regulator
MKAVAQFLGLHYATVSRALGRSEVPRENPRARRAVTEKGGYVIYAYARFAALKRFTRSPDFSEIWRAHDE